MTVRILRRLIQGGWVAVAVVAVVLLVDTGEFIRSAGLFAVRPPLSTTQTALRLVIVAGAIASLAVFRRTLERITLMLGVAAAGSSALYGVGLRFQGLAAFRLLSHFVLYLFALACAVTALYADARQARSPRRGRIGGASMSRPVKRLPTIVVMVVFALAFIALAFVQYAKTRAGQMPPNIGQQPGAIRR